MPGDSPHFVFTSLLKGRSTQENSLNLRLELASRNSTPPATLGQLSVAAAIGRRH